MTSGDEMQTFVTKDYAQTVALGEKIGRTLKGGEVLAFFGGMGMGLTCEVSSPTFAIVNVYGKNAELCHFDMYRVETWADLDSTGFFEYMDAGSVLCVEWSENIENALPQDAIRITIKLGNNENERVITIDGWEEKA